MVEGGVFRSAFLPPSDPALAGIEARAAAPRPLASSRSRRPEVGQIGMSERGHGPTEVAGIRRHCARARALAEEAANTLREFILLGKLEAGPCPSPSAILAAALEHQPYAAQGSPAHSGNRGTGRLRLDPPPTRRRPDAWKNWPRTLTVLGTHSKRSPGELACVKTGNGCRDRPCAAQLCEKRMTEAASATTDPLVTFFRWDMEFHTHHCSRPPAMHHLAGNASGTYQRPALACALYLVEDCAQAARQHFEASTRIFFRGASRSATPSTCARHLKAPSRRRRSRISPAAKNLLQDDAKSEDENT